MPEKPPPCNQCKKNAEILYTEIIDGVSTTVSMCHDCPLLHEKLYPSSLSEKDEDLICPQCHTTLTSVIKGNPLGCRNCYKVFQQHLIDQLIKTQAVSSRLKPQFSTKAAILHIGKSPFFHKDEEVSRRLHELHESLADALSNENYEEAAWIRDQIREKMDTNNG